MKSLKVFLTLTVFMSLVLNIACALPLREEDEDDNNNAIDFDEEAGQFSLQHGGLGRFLVQKKMKRRRLTCNKFPRICLAKGSPGPYCCKKKRVNVLTNCFNCGACKKKCEYNEICCNGKCLNPLYNRSHCGGCNNGCSSGSFCVFGLCNYA